jgi:L-2-hydroxycarboxylate dehydrogenase (NAD+)
MDALGALTAGMRPADGKPDLFLPLDAYRREVSSRIDMIKAAPRQMGVAEIRIPGERGYMTRARLVREGIEIDRRIYDALRRLAGAEPDHGD